jgi:hypothetical protein
MGWGGVLPSLPHAASVTDLFATTWETVVRPSQGQGGPCPPGGRAEMPALPGRGLNAYVAANNLAALLSATDAGSLIESRLAAVCQLATPSGETTNDLGYDVF